MKKFCKKYGLWVLLLASAALLSLSLFFFAKRNNWLDKEFAYQGTLHRIDDKLKDLNHNIRNTESDLRGYIASGIPEFVSDFENNLLSLQQTARLLYQEKNTTGLDSISAGFLQLETLVERRIALLQSTRNIADSNRGKASGLLLQGRLLSDSINRQVHELHTSLSVKMNASSKNFLSVNRRNNKLAYISLSASLILLLTAFYFLRKAIKRRENARKELKLQKEQFRATLQSIQEGIISTDKEGRIKFMNPSAERLTGWNWREAKKQPLQNVYNIQNETSGIRSEEVFETIVKKGKLNGWENNTILQSKNNEQFIISRSGAPVYDEQGNLEGVVLLFNDITEKKKLQDKIKENELLLRSIIQAEPECVKLIARNGELLEMNKAGLAMIEADDLQQVKGASVYEFVCEPYREEFTRLTGNVFNGTSGMLEFEITGLKGTRRWMETHAVPLKNAEGKIISLLGVSRDITERKQAEEKLRIADQRLASHLNNSPIGVIEWDKDFVIREWSAQAEKIFGWKQEEVLGKHFRDFKMVFEEDAAAVEKLSLDLIEKRTEQYTSINRNYTKDGRVIYCEWFNSVLKDEHGNIQSILSLILDITGQKKNEERLIQLSQAVEQSPASVVITDTRGDIEYVNKKFTDITGYLPQEVIGANPRILKSGYTSTEEYEKLWNVITSGREWYGEFYNRKKDGELYWEAAHISPIMNSENEITGFLAVKEDITEKKKAEEELLNSKKRFQNLVENISGVYWVNDLETYQTLYISPSYEKIWGRKCDDLYKDPADFMQAIHPDDLSIVTTAFEQQSINGKTEIIYRIIRPDGSLRWIFAKTNVVVDSNGRKMEYGYAEDITEIKLAEQSLRESEETFRRLFNESADPVLLLDERGFVDFNRAAISMLGYTSGKEFLYKKPWDISPTQQPDGKLSEKKAQEMIDKALQLGYNRFEWIYIKSDGTEFPVEVMLTPIMLKGRQSFYTVWRDIADRKKAEKKIEEILKRYEILAQATSDTIWDWDIAHNKMVYNYGITSMFGYDIAQVESIPDWWQNNIHPDDIKMVTDRVEEIFKKQETVFQMEFRYRCADGSYKNILDRAIVMYDEKKNPIRMVGAMQDITFQKEKELLINKAIIDAQERERQQMGMELHDNVNQILSASLLYLGMAKNEKKNKNEIFETINQTSGFIKDAITETRRLSHQLAPVSFKDVSLREVVESLAKNMNSQNQWRVSVQFDENHNATVRDDIKINLYRIIQEQLNNISKYARASEVAIIVTTLENKIQLKVIDNGIGFDPKTVKRGIGLENIKRRTEVFSGLLTIISSPGNGCQVVVELPLKNV